MKKHHLALAILVLAVPARGHDWQFERVDTAGNWSSPTLKLSRTGVMHFCYLTPDRRVVHSYLDSAWHREEIGPFPSLAGYDMDAGAHNELGLLLDLSEYFWLWEKRDTMWQQESVPIPLGVGGPRFSYDTAGAPSAVVSLTTLPPSAVLYAKRTGSVWVSETAGVSIDILRTHALTNTVRGEPCAVVWQYLGVDSYIRLFIQQADTWGRYTAASGGNHEHLKPLAYAPDTGGGAAIAYNYQDIFPSVESLMYRGFRMDARSVDSGASSGRLAVDGSGAPHLSYISVVLKYASLIDAAWHLDTVFAATGLLLGGIVLEGTDPVIGFVDRATGIWLARRLPAGVQEPSRRTRWRPSQTITVGFLCAPQVGDHRVRHDLLDSSGRLVSELHPGPNDVRHLAPGVYFVLEHGSAAMRKVVVTR